jgi:hypothetical protein
MHAHFLNWSPRSVHGRTRFYKKKKDKLRLKTKFGTRVAQRNLKEPQAITLSNTVTAICTMFQNIKLYIYVLRMILTVNIEYFPKMH